MPNIFDKWRCELGGELAEAVAERDAALMEQAEAEAALAGIRAELAMADGAIHALARRSEAEREIAEAGAVILRAAPRAIATALTPRLEEMREVARAAETRVVRAGHVVDQVNARISDLRQAVEQLDLLTSSADEATAA